MRCFSITHILSQLWYWSSHWTLPRNSTTPQWGYMYFYFHPILMAFISWISSVLISLIILWHVQLGINVGNAICHLVHMHDMRNQNRIIMTNCDKLLIMQTSRSHACDYLCQLYIWHNVILLHIPIAKATKVTELKSNVTDIKWKYSLNCEIRAPLKVAWLSVTGFNHGFMK